MAPLVKDVIDILEEMAPSRYAEDWDNPGLQVGLLTQGVHKIMVSLDPTRDAVKRAIKSQAQLLLTHHPLIYRPLRRLDRSCYPGDVITEALAHDISVVSAHTNLDVAKGGMNDMLAEFLGLEQPAILQNLDEKEGQEAGLGRIGRLAEPVSLATLINQLKIKFGLDTVKVQGDTDRTIRRIAVVGGSGGSLAGIAAQQGADALITGDIGHHHALDARGLGLALIDIGHFHSEKKALSLLASKLEKDFQERNWKVVLEFYEEESDPLVYV
jgi:dinuclear metal center YbgI/SA1388 family protein